MKKKIFREIKFYDKNEFIKILNMENARLDLIRNGIYCLLSAFNYSSGYSIEQDLVNEFSNKITDLSNEIGVFLKKMNLQVQNIKIGEVNNEKK